MKVAKSKPVGALSSTTQTPLRELREDSVFLDQRRRLAAHEA